MTKEDKILEIIEKWHYSSAAIPEIRRKQSAKEIAALDAEGSVIFAKEQHSHYMKFLAWLFSKDSKYGIAYGSDKPLCTEKGDFTVDEVYQHWFALTENKRQLKNKFDICFKIYNLQKISENVIFIFEGNE